MQSKTPIPNRNSRIWLIFSYILLFIQCALSVVVLYLSLHLDNMESTKIYLGFFQALIGMVLALLCVFAIKITSKTLVIFSVVCSIIMNLACGIMFILVELSEDFQYYSGDEAPLEPAHPKKWFLFYKVYFILSLTLSTYSVLMTPCLCKASSIFMKKKPDPSFFRSLITNNTYTDDKSKQISINNFDEEIRKEEKKLKGFQRKLEFQKPLLLKDCMISFEPHKGLDSGEKNLINSLKSDLNTDLNSEKNENLMHMSYPPTMKIKYVKGHKNSDHRSVDKWRNSGLHKMFKRIKKG